MRVSVLLRRTPLQGLAVAEREEEGADVVLGVEERELGTRQSNSSKPDAPGAQPGQQNSNPESDAQPSSEAAAASPDVSFFILYVIGEIVC